MSREVGGIVPCFSRKNDRSGNSSVKGKIYAFEHFEYFANDGDKLNDKKVRRQFITLDGEKFPINSIKKIYLNDTLHHLEIGAERVG